MCILLTFFLGCSDANLPPPPPGSCRWRGGCPQAPLAIVGGSKVSSKIGVIESLLDKCDKIILG